MTTTATSSLGAKSSAPAAMTKPRNAQSTRDGVAPPAPPWASQSAARVAPSPAADKRLDMPPTPAPSRTWEIAGAI